MRSFWVPAWGPLYFSVLASLYFQNRAIVKRLWYFQTLRFKAKRAAGVSPVPRCGNGTPALK